MASEREIAEQFDAWNDALRSGDPDQVVELYADDAILLPTMSNRVRHNPAEIRDYFVHFLARKPEGEILEQNIRCYVDIALNSGLYRFHLGAGGEKVDARFSFVYRRQHDGWRIVEHHSSILPE